MNLEKAINHGEHGVCKTIGMDSFGRQLSPYEVLFRVSPVVQTRFSK